MRGPDRRRGGREVTSVGVLGLTVVVGAGVNRLGLPPVPLSSLPSVVSSSFLYNVQPFRLPCLQPFRGQYVLEFQTNSLFDPKGFVTTINHKRKVNKPDQSVTT